jgi:polar amino acid transport system permease protein
VPLVDAVVYYLFQYSDLAGFDVPAFFCRIASAYGSLSADIWRGSVESIPKAQWEAGTSLGLSWLQQFRYVILPQAVSIHPTYHRVCRSAY